MIKLFENHITQEVYLEILASHLLPFGLNRFGTDWFLHQDNDPKHTSRLCAFFLEQNEIKYSPDLNPIKMVWADMKKYIASQMCESIEQVSLAISEY